MYEITKAFKGSPNGWQVISYKVGDIVSVGDDFSESLLKVCLHNGWAEEVKAAPKPVKKKAVKRK